MAEVDESTPLETCPELRDAYCRSKLAQEALVLGKASTSGLIPTILRLGAVFGPGRLWNGHLGFKAASRVFQIGSKGNVPVCHVDHAAKAIVSAAIAPSANTRILNVVDDDQPSRAEYLRHLRQTGGFDKVVQLPLLAFRCLARLLAWFPARPGLLKSPTLEARLKPLVYSNAALKRELGWSCDRSFAEAFSASIESGLA